MRASMRWMPLLAVVAASCSDDPQPLTGQASWSDGCPMSMCTSSTHSVRGAAGSPTVDVDCSLAQVSGGYRVTFRIASITEGANFDQSTEGLSIKGFLPAVGQELRSATDYSATATIRGLGWVINEAALGPTSPCHVVITNLSNGGFKGTLSCPEVQDTSVTPPRARLIRGGSDAMNPDLAEFVFANCVNGG